VEKRTRCPERDVAGSTCEPQVSRVLKLPVYLKLYSLSELACLMSAKSRGQLAEI